MNKSRKRTGPGDSCFNQEILRRIGLETGLPSLQTSLFWGRCQGSWAKLASPCGLLAQAGSLPSRLEAVQHGLPSRYRFPFSESCCTGAAQAPQMLLDCSRSVACADVVFVSACTSRLFCSCPLRAQAAWHLHGRRAPPCRRLCDSWAPKRQPCVAGPACRT